LKNKRILSKLAASIPANSKLLVLLSVLFVAFAYAADTIESLEAQKNQLKKEMAELDKMIKTAEGNKKGTIVRLKVLREKINKRNRHIAILNKDLTRISRNISDDTDIIIALERDMNLLKEEYAQMIYISSKVNNSFNKLSFIFSSQTFNQLTMRMKYLTMFSRSRRLQVEKIKQLKIHLERQKAALEDKKNSKEELLLSVQREQNKLNLDKKEEEETLKSESKQVAKHLEDKRKKEKELLALDKLIIDLINKRKEKNSKSSAEEKKKFQKLSDDFAANKGRLPSPFSSTCFISKKFGKQPHPVIKGVYVNNLGIGIQTNKGASVKAVFGGKVFTGNIPGMGKVVMIEHGGYYTVYANLSNITVKSNDVVNIRDKIGTVLTRDGETELEFQVWKGNEKQDPEKWLADF